MSLSYRQICRVVYADSGAVIGTDSGMVAEAQEKINVALQRAGFETHEETGPCEVSQLLGHVIDGHSLEIKPTAHRLWRIHQACLWLEEGQKNYGRGT